MALTAAKGSQQAFILFPKGQERLQDQVRAELVQSRTCMSQSCLTQVSKALCLPNGRCKLTPAAQQVAQPPLASEVHQTKASQICCTGNCSLGSRGSLGSRRSHLLGSKGIPGVQARCSQVTSFHKSYGQYSW